jgi:hypothetical protein
MLPSLSSKSPTLLRTRKKITERTVHKILTVLCEVTRFLEIFKFLASYFSGSFPSLSDFLQHVGIYFLAGIQHHCFKF